MFQSHIVFKSRLLYLPEPLGESDIPQTMIRILKRQTLQTKKYAYSVALWTVKALWLD